MAIAISQFNLEDWSMYRLKMLSGIHASAIALLTLSIAGTGSLASGEAQAQNADPNCRSVAYYPGAVSVVGKAQGTATAGDFRDCSVTYQCGANARRVQSVTFGVASPGSLMAGETFAIASDSSEAILSSCEAAERNGRRTRACAAEPQEFTQPTAIAEEAVCTVVVGTPAGGRMVGTTTCLCE